MCGEKRGEAGSWQGERWKGKQEERSRLLSLSIGGWPCSFYSWLLSSSSGRKTEANLLLPESILLLVPRQCWNLSWKMPPLLLKKEDVNISCFHHFHFFLPFQVVHFLSSLCRILFSHFTLSTCHFDIVFLYLFLLLSFLLLPFLPLIVYNIHIFTAMIKAKNPFFFLTLISCESRQWHVIIG